MDKNTKRQIESFIIPYLSKQVPNFQMAKTGSLFTCPKCTKVSANLYPPTSYMVHCFAPECGKIGNIFDIARTLEYEGNQDLSDDDIADFLIPTLGIKINNEVNSLLEKYNKWGWSLFPVVKDSKIPLEKKWPEKTHKDINEWQGWINNGSGLGVKCGKDSGIIAIDCDLISKEEAEIWQKGSAVKTIEEIAAKKQANIEKLKSLKLFPETAMQDSGWKGIHYFYKYDADVPKSSFNYEGFHFDVQSDGGYCLVEPSTYKGRGRIISGEIIAPLSTELKEFILKNITAKTTSNDSNNALPDGEVINPENMKGLDGNCNNTFIQMMGQFRKYMPLNNVEKTAHIINKQMLDTPMDTKSIKSMTNQIEKYHVADIDVIGDKIIEHLRIVETAHIRDLVECLGFDRKDLEKSLKNLTEHKKLYKIKKDLYKLILDTVWQEDFLSLGKPLGVKVPYFDTYANFDSSSMIIIGATSGTGKTVLSMNMIKSFVDQGICPYLISTEAGSKFQKTAQTLGLKEGDFKYFVTNDPSTVVFPKNAVVIIDWLKPKGSAYEQTDTLYESFNDKLVENGGLLIIMAQLKKESNSFYAENMVTFFGALVAKFLYPQVNGVFDNNLPYFKTEKIRDSKTNQQYLTIPLKYDNVSKKVDIR